MCLCGNSYMENSAHVLSCLLMNIDVSIQLYWVALVELYFVVWYHVFYISLTDPLFMYILALDCRNEIRKRCWYLELRCLPVVWHCQDHILVTEVSSRMWYCKDHISVTLLKEIKTKLEVSFSYDLLRSFSADTWYTWDPHGFQPKGSVYVY